MGRRENRNEDRSINIFEPCGEDVADIHQLLWLHELAAPQTRALGIAVGNGFRSSDC